MKQRHLLLSMLITTVSLTLCALSESHQFLKCALHKPRDHIAGYIVPFHHLHTVLTLSE